MKPALHTRRFAWLAGVLLLVGTVVGAGVAFNSGTPAQDARQSAAGDLPPGIVSIGLIDIEPGVINLYPVQQGRVVFTVKEGYRAEKAGEVLLRLDDRLAKLRVVEAAADLDAAKVLARQAENLPAQHEEKIKQQKAAVAAAEHQKASAEEELKIKERAYEDKLVSIFEKNAVAELVKKLGSIVTVEQGKLKELMLLDPQVNVDRAKADVAAKEARLEQARLALTECELTAPMPGTVLRVQVHPGEILGANPKTPAIQFAPAGPMIVRAEVLQEWANKVKLDQVVDIEDDTFAGPKWKGKVRGISNWFTQKRNVILEPFMYNDVRTLECLIEVIPDQANPTLRIGQRVRVTIR